MNKRQIVTTQSLAVPAGPTFVGVNTSDTERIVESAGIPLDAMSNSTSARRMAELTVTPANTRSELDEPETDKSPQSADRGTKCNRIVPKRESAPHSIDSARVVKKNSIRET